MPTSNLLSLTLTLKKTFWKCHDHFACKWMGDIRSVCLFSEILFGGNSHSYTIFAIDSDT